MVRYPFATEDDLGHPKPSGINETRSVEPLDAYRLLMHIPRSTPPLSKIQRATIWIHALHRPPRPERLSTNISGKTTSCLSVTAIMLPSNVTSLSVWTGTTHAPCVAIPAILRKKQTMSNNIHLYFHCRACQSGMLAVGWTRRGLQVWCENCDTDVLKS